MADEALCAHAVHLGAPILTLNALEDPRFCDNPLVLGEPRIRFYAACPGASKPGSWSIEYQADLLYVFLANAPCFMASKFSVFSTEMQLRI